jgi:hypothetical protein
MANVRLSQRRSRDSGKPRADRLGRIGYRLSATGYPRRSMGRGRRKFRRPRFVVLSRILSGPFEPGRSFISSGRGRTFRQAECDYYPRALGYPSGKAHQLSVLSCTARGLSCDPARAGPGGLLPRHFTLIPHRRDGIFSVTLSVTSNLRPRCPRFRTACCFPGVRTFLYRTRFEHSSDRLPTRQF